MQVSSSRKAAFVVALAASILYSVGCGRSGPTGNAEGLEYFRSDVQSTFYGLALVLQPSGTGVSVADALRRLSPNQRGQYLYTRGRAALHVNDSIDCWRHPDLHSNEVAVYGSFSDRGGAHHLVYRKFGGSLDELLDFESAKFDGKFVTAEDFDTTGSSRN
jgi:hypothetical protein